MFKSLKEKITLSDPNSRNKLPEIRDIDGNEEIRHNASGEQNLSRFSSISSLVSDVGTAFSKALTIPQHVQPANRNSKQFYDYESMSEYDDSVIQGDIINKEELFHRYQKAQSLAKRYKTRSMEMVECYKRLEVENAKLTQTLTESQDHSIRRVSELREEMKLDRQAKTDVEENYRLMIDEKTELINVLRLQISLLREGKDLPVEVESQIREKHELEIQSQKMRDDEIRELKNSLSHRENLLQRCKEKITSLRSQLTEVQMKYDNINKASDGSDSLNELISVDLSKQSSQHAAALEDLQRDHSERIRVMLHDFEEKRRLFESELISDFEEKKRVFEFEISIDYEDKMFNIKKELKDLNDQINRLCKDKEGLEEELKVKTKIIEDISVASNNEREELVERTINIEQSSMDYSDNATNDLKDSVKGTNDMGIFDVGTEREVKFLPKKGFEECGEKCSFTEEELNNLKGQMNRLSEINEQLKEQVEEMQVLKCEKEEQILKFREDVKNLEFGLKREKDDFDSMKNEFDEKLSRTEADLFNLRGEMRCLSQDNEGLREQVTLKAKIIDDARIDDLRGEIKSLLNHVEELETMNLQKAGELSTYQETINNVELLLQTVKEQFKKNEADFEAELSNVNLELIKYKNEMSTLSEDNDTLKEALIVKSKMIEEAQVDDLKVEIKCLLNKVDEMKKVESERNTETNELQEKIKNVELCLKEEQNSRELEVGELRAQLNLSISKYDELRLELNNKDTILSNYNLQIEELLRYKRDFDALNVEMRKKTDENSELSSSLQDAIGNIEELQRKLENFGLLEKENSTNVIEDHLEIKDPVAEDKITVIDLEMNLEKLNQQKEELRLRLGAEEEAKEEILTKLNTINKEFLELKGKAQLLKSEKKVLLKNTERLTSLIVENHNVIKDLQSQNIGTEAALKERMSETEDLKSELQQCKIINLELVGKEEELQSTCSSQNEENLLLRKRIEDLINESRTIEAKVKGEVEELKKNDEMSVAVLKESLLEARNSLLEVGDVMKAVGDLFIEFQQADFGGKERESLENTHERAHDTLSPISELRKLYFDKIYFYKDQLRVKDDFIRKHQSEKEVFAKKLDKMVNDRSQHFRTLANILELQNIDFEQKSFTKAVMRGVKDYVKKCVELSSQLDESLSRINDLQRELEIKTEECRSKQLELTELRDTVSDNRSRLLSTRQELDRSVRRLNEFADEKGRIDEEKQSLRKELNQLNEKIQELKSEFEKQSIEKQKLEQQFDESLEKVKINHLALEENYKKEIEKQNNYHHYLEVKISANQEEACRKLTEKEQVSNIKLDEVLKQSEQLLVLNHQYNELLGQSKAEMNGLTERLKGTELRCDKLELEKQTLAIENQELTRAQGEILKERDSLQVEIESMSRDRESSRQTLMNVQSANDSIEVEKSKYLENIRNLESENRANVGKIRSIQESFDGVKGECDRLTTAKEKLAQLLEKERDNYSQLEAQNQDLKRFQVKVDSLKLKLQKRKEDNEKEVFEIKQQFSEDKSNIEDDHNHRVKKLAKDFNEKMLLKEQDFQKTFHDALKNVREEEARQKADLKAQLDSFNHTLIEMETERNCLLDKISDSDEEVRRLRSVLVTKDDQHNALLDEIASYKNEMNKLELQLSNMSASMRELEQRSKKKEIVESHNSFCEDSLSETVNANDHEVLKMHCSDLEEQVRQMHLENISLKDAVTANQMISSTPILLTKSHHLTNQPSFDNASVKSSNIFNSVALRSPNTSCSEYQFCPYPITDATEYEYLRDILVKYMTGMETITLARVLCTVMKLSVDETDRILRFEQDRRKGLQVIF